MAKRKSSKKRKGRVGAAGALSAKSTVVKAGSLIGGYLLSDKIQEQMDKMLGQSGVDSKWINLALAGGGLYYLFMYKGKKNLPLSVIAGLLAGAGAKGALTDFGILSGFSSIPVVGNMRNVPVLGNYAVPQPSLSGINAGYEVPNASIIGAIPDAASGSGINPTDR